MQYYIIVNALFDDSQFAYGEHLKEDFKTGKAKICSSCGSYISMLEWLPPFEIKISKKKIGDFIFGTYVGFVVSENFKEKYIQNKDLNSLTSFKKVDLYYKKNILKEDYYYSEIPLINAFVDLNRIELDGKELCKTCQKGKNIIKKINGIDFIRPNQINEDIFFTTALGQSTIIVSENFKEFALDENFTNLKLIKASHYKWDSLNPIDNINV